MVKEVRKSDKMFQLSLFQSSTFNGIDFSCELKLGLMLIKIISNDSTIFLLKVTFL